MKFALSVIFACALAMVCQAQDEGLVTINMSKCDAREVIALYQRLTDKPAFLALDLQALVSVETPAPIARSAAIELIRTTLLERYGIEIRATDQGDTLVAWSKNPKYPRHSESVPAKPERRVLPNGRVHIAKPDAIP